LRTSETEITAIVARTTMSAAPISVSATPIALEIGPMTATPTGISAKEPREAEERVGLLEPPWADDLGDEARRGRHEEGGRASAQRGQHDQVPRLRDACEEERRRGELCAAAEQVRRDHDEVAWQAVRPDAAGEQEDEVRQHVRREHESEIGGGAGQDDDRERESDRRERAAEQRDRAPEEEQAEVALGKRTERETAEQRSQPQGGGHRPVSDCERYG
jgi:hypothetical protein